MSSFEMDDLSSDARAERNGKQNTPEDQSEIEKANAISMWTWTAASLLSLMAALLVLFPQFLLFLSETGASERRLALTPLEAFLANSLGIWLFALAVSLISNMPSTSPFVATDTRASPDHSLLVPSTAACLLISFLSYNTKLIGTLGSINFLVFGTVGLWGLWVIVFGSSLRVSKKTGADKHTSSFIFGNNSSASKQKKKWVKQHES